MDEENLIPEVGDTVIFNEHEVFDSIAGLYRKKNRSRND